MNTQERARQIVEELRQHKIVKLGKPATPDHIAKAQLELLLLLPDLYRQILLITGQINIYERSMFGLGPSAERWGRYNGITATEFTTMAREEPDVRLPPHLVVVWHDSHRDYQCLDTSRVVDGDCPIVLFDTEIAATEAREPKLLATNIADWLRNRVVEQFKLKVDWDEYVKTRGPGFGKRRTRKKKVATKKATPKKAASKKVAKRAKSKKRR